MNNPENLKSRYHAYFTEAFKSAVAEDNLKYAKWDNPYPNRELSNELLLSNQVNEELLNSVNRDKGSVDISRGESSVPLEIDFLRGELGFLEDLVCDLSERIDKILSPIGINDPTIKSLVAPEVRKNPCELSLNINEVARRIQAIRLFISELNKRVDL